jgi:thiol-disulfide isomerase/thioredoxin
MRRIMWMAIAVAAIQFAYGNGVRAADPPAQSGTQTDQPVQSEKKTEQTASKDKATVKRPADRVAVMYFHRTNRCPTCRKMGGYTEEAVKKGFVKPMKDGKVEFYFVNFEDEKNEKLVKGYKISGPTLIVAKIKKNKVVEFQNLKEMWNKVGDKDEFLKYVRENVTDYLTKKDRKTPPAK